MKKYFLTAAALLLLSPLTASADIVATGSMIMYASDYTQRANFGTGTYNYAVDYEADISSVTLKSNYEDVSFEKFPELYKEFELNYSKDKYIVNTSESRLHFIT